MFITKKKHEKIRAEQLDKYFKLKKEYQELEWKYEESIKEQKSLQDKIFYLSNPK